MAVSCDLGGVSDWKALSLFEEYNYVLWSSRINLKSGALIVWYSQNFENPSIALAHNFGTTGPIQVGFSAKMYLSKCVLQ